MLANKMRADISEKLSDDELSDYKQLNLNQESSIEALHNARDGKSRNYSNMAKYNNNPLRYASTNVSKSTRLIDRRGNE